MKQAMVLVSKEGDEMKAKLQAQIGRLLARNMPPDRFLALAMREVSKSSKLMKCSALSVCASIVEAAIMGLELGSVTGQAYLVPFKETCQLIVGYKGLILLAWRDAKIITHADIIQEADQYEVIRGSHPEIVHRPALNVERGGVVGAYAIFTYPDGRTIPVFHDYLELERRRLRSRAKDEGPWMTDKRAMQMKCPIRDGASKFIPFDTAASLVSAANRDDLRESGLGAQFDPETLQAAAEVTGDDPVMILDGGIEGQPEEAATKGVTALKDRLKQKSDPLIPVKLVKDIGKASEDAGWTPMAFRSMLKEKFGVGNETQIKASQFDDVMRIVQGGTGE